MLVQNSNSKDNIRHINVFDSSKSLLIVLLLCVTSSLSMAQSYTTSFVTDDDKAGWQQYRMKYKGTLYPWDFGIGQFYSDEGYISKSVLSHRGNNVDGVPDTIVDWMVSPALRFLSPAELYVRYHTGGYSSPGSGFHGCKVYFSGGSPDPAMGDYEEIADLTINLPSYGYKWHDTNIHISQTAARGYIAFVYYIEGKSWFEMSIDSVATTAPLGISDRKIGGQSSITIFPNPTQGQLTIESGELNISTIEILDILGKNIGRIYPNEKNKIINISHLPPGIYFARIQINEGVIMQKIIKQ